MLTLFLLFSLFSHLVFSTDPGTPRPVFSTKRNGFSARRECYPQDSGKLRIFKLFPVAAKIATRATKCDRVRFLSQIVQPLRSRNDCSISWKITPQYSNTLENRIFQLSNYIDLVKDKMELVKYISVSQILEQPLKENGVGFRIVIFCICAVTCDAVVVMSVFFN